MQQDLEVHNRTRLDAAVRAHRDLPRRDHRRRGRLLRRAGDRGGPALRATPPAGRSSRPRSCASSPAAASTSSVPVEHRWSLKGLPEPVPTVEVRWQPPAARIPSSRCRPGWRATRPPAWWAATRSRRRLECEPEGGRCPATVPGPSCSSGEPGIGKTTLASRHGPARPRRWGDGPLRPLRRRARGALPALRRGARASCSPTPPRPPSSRSISVSWRSWPACCRRSAISTPTCPSTPSTDSEADQYRLFNAVGAVLTHLGGPHPGGVRARRPALGRQADGAPAPPPRDDAAPHAGAPARHLPESDLSASHPMTAGLAALRREATVERIVRRRPGRPRRGRAARGPRRSRDRRGGRRPRPRSCAARPVATRSSPRRCSATSWRPTRCARTTRAVGA